MKKSIELPQDRQNVKELTVTILGNANSGKSTLTGILTNPLLINFIDKDYNITEVPSDILDNGNGKSRSKVLQFIHEKKTGRTSSITYNYMVLEDGYKVISFVDLAGHESYLKTTIGGITSSYPDFAFICIEKTITNITKEHLSLVHCLDIPFAILMTKIDIIPEEKLKQNLEKLNRILKCIDKKMFIIKKMLDLDTFKFPSTRWVPVIFMSNITGRGIDKVVKQIGNIKKKSNILTPDAFVVDNIYNVQGYGLVVSGVTGIEINKNDTVFIGPFNSCKENRGFIKTKVRTIHDDYRNFVDTLDIGQRGCLCIKLDNTWKKNMRAGLVLTKHIEQVKPVKRFKANIQIFYGHATSIKPGYSAFMNSGIIRSGVKFKKIYDQNGENELNIIRSGNTSVVEVEFLKNRYCVVPGEKFIFREGNTRGLGIIMQ